MGKLLAISAFSMLAHWCALAQGTAFTYQGQLSDGGQSANGSYDFRFTLVDAATNKVAGPLTNAPVIATKGIFLATLDFGPNAFDGSLRRLEIAVRTNGSIGGYTLLSP